MQTDMTINKSFVRYFKILAIACILMAVTLMVMSGAMIEAARSERKLHEEKTASYEEKFRELTAACVYVLTTKDTELKQARQHVDYLDKQIARWHASKWTTEKKGVGP